MAKTKIKKKKNVQKKEEKNTDEISKDNILVAAIIILIVAFGSIVYISRNFGSSQPRIIDSSEVKHFKNFVFEKEGDVWITTLKIRDDFEGWEKDYQIAFHYTPDEVEHIETLTNVRNESIAPNIFVNSRNIYITTDPEYPSEVILSGVEIAKILGRIYERDVRSALTREDSRAPDANIITCDDLSSKVRVIELRLGNSTEIISENGCIIVQGTNSTEMLKAAERLTYEMLKIL